MYYITYRHICNMYIYHLCKWRVEEYWIAISVSSKLNKYTPIVEDRGQGGGICRNATSKSLGDIRKSA